MPIVKLSELAESFPEAEVDYEDMIGWPYRVSGRVPTGIDCIGVVLEVFRRAGLGLPDPDASPGGVLAFQELLEPVAAPDQLYDLISLKRSTYHVEVVVRHGVSISAREKAGTHTTKTKFLQEIPGVQFFRVRADLLP